MSIGLAVPRGITDADVEAVARGIVTRMFRTGTGAVASTTAVGQAYAFSTGEDVFVGEGVTAIGNGQYKLTAGTYALKAHIRCGNYSNAGGLLTWRWRDFTNGVSIGRQSIQYAMSSSSRYTHQPGMEALIVVPAGQTIDVGPAFVAGTANMTYNINEIRSSLTIEGVL